MNQILRMLPIVIVSFASAALAQTAVTTDGTGTAQNFPVYTGPTALTSSILYQGGTSVGGGIGINTSAPQYSLDIHGGAAFTPVGINIYNWFGDPEAASTENITFSGEANPTGFAMIESGGDPTCWSCGAGYLAFKTANGGAVLNEGMRLNPGGQLGIGTAVPQSALHVASAAVALASNGGPFGNGNVVIQGLGGRSTSAGAGLSFATAANTDGSNVWEQARILATADMADNEDASGRLYLQTRAITNGAWGWNNNLVLSSAGYVGVGTPSSPTQPLEVNGSIKMDAGSLIFPDGTSFSSASGNINVKNALAAAVTIESDAAPGASYGSSLALVGNMREWSLVNWNSGNGGVYPGSLGIGDATSGLVRQLFDPSGDIYIGLKSGDGFVNTSSLSVLANGNIGIGSVTPVAPLQIGAETAIQNVVGFQSAFGNNTYYDGSNWRYFTAGPASAFRMYNGNIAFNTVTTGAAGAIASTMDVTGRKMLLFSSGGLALGNNAIAGTDPGAGNLNVSGTITASGGITTVGTITAGSGIVFPNGVVQTVPYTGAAASLPANVDYTDQPQTISAQKTFTGGVSVSTGGPGTPFTVQGAALGNTSGNTTALMTLQNNNANANYLTFSQFRNTDGWDWTTATTRIQTVTDVTPQGYIDFNPPNGGFGLAMGSNGSEYFRIASGGNVGIGTITPGARLEVNGNLKLTSGSGASITFPDGTVQSTAYVGTTCSTGGEELGPATTPSGSCSTNGAWAFSQDGHATFCASGTWTTKI